MNKSLVGLPAAAHLPTKTVAKLSVAAVVVAVAGLLSGCDASKATEGAHNTAAALPKGFLQIKPESVKMLEIAAVTDPQGLQMAWAPAHVAFVEDRVASASVPISARVVTVNAHVGDMVKAGDLLATLVSPDALRTRYDVAAAKTAHDVAVVEAQRQQNMVNKGVGVEVDLRAAQAKLRETSQELGRAQGTAALLGSGGGDRIELRAPRAGIVAERKAVVGNAADPGAALFMIGDSQAMNVVAEVFESDLPGIRLGSAVQVEVPQLAKRAITPHVIRHTTACHLVQAGVDINTIRAWLGHVSISTTNIYAEIDMTMKANAIALCEVGTPMGGRSWKGDKDLMAFLKSL